MPPAITPQASTTLAKTVPRTVARSLSDLAHLIQIDLLEGRGAAERAAMPYYQAAGAKLIEAKSKLPHGKFTGWVRQHFGVSQKQATFYMRLAADSAERSEKKLPAGNFSSINDFDRQTASPTKRRASATQDQLAGEVNEVIEHIDDAAFKRDELARAHEREAARLLAIRLIDLGYKALARTLHPDKGGSPEIMTRLNAVRDHLKEQA